ncbi:MAG: response regulator [Pseudomonadota bacterium]
MNAPPTLLLVDDEPANIDLLKGVLPADCKFRVAINGEKALQIAQKTPVPDLVFLDVMMPGMDGYEVCRRLKADPATAGIPVVFLSGHTDETERQKGLALGAADFLSKPIDPERVNAALRRVTGGQVC